MTHTIRNNAQQYAPAGQREHMKYWKLRNAVCMAVIVMLGLPSAWADDTSRCKQLYSQKQYELALPICKKEAEQGRVNAQVLLGAVYTLGMGVKQDSVEAMKWWRKAAEQGDVDAQFQLGLAYARGDGVKNNATETAKWWRRAAEQGHAEAQFQLARMYIEGATREQSFAEATAEVLKWYRKAAEQGHAEAQFSLGVIYDSGLLVKKDYTEAIKWYRKAAEQGYLAAQTELGRKYTFGTGVKESGAAAADWYYKAGMNELKQGNKDNALRNAEKILALKEQLHLSVPNMFLADRLLKAIYSGGSQSTNKTKQKKKKPTISFGTGWPISGSYVVTNNHVVAGHKKFVLLRTDGVEIPATVVMRDAVNDLALLKVEDWAKLPPALPLAKSSVHIGAKVFTIGYPHPTMMGAKPKLTDGTVSSTTGLGDDPRAYQISVPLQAGNSGGPLLNMNGEVVGIVTAKLSAAKIFEVTGDLPQNVNYAVKASYLKALLGSVSPSIKHIKTLPANKASLEELAARIKDSVLIVVAK